MHWETYDTPTKTVSGMSFWLSRDPISDGMLYAFVKNCPVYKWDYLGLICIRWGPWSEPTFHWENDGFFLDEKVMVCVCYADKVRVRTAPGKDIGLFYCRDCTVTETKRRNRAGSWMKAVGELPNIPDDPNSTDASALCANFCKTSFNPNNLGSPVF